jgi:hypothetical protein
MIAWRHSDRRGRSLRARHSGALAGVVETTLHMQLTESAYPSPPPCIRRPGGLFCGFERPWVARAARLSQLVSSDLANDRVKESSPRGRRLALSWDQRQRPGRPSGLPLVAGWGQRVPCWRSPLAADARRSPESVSTLSQSLYREAWPATPSLAASPAGLAAWLVPRCWGGCSHGRP